MPTCALVGLCDKDKNVRGRDIRITLIATMTESDANIMKSKTCIQLCFMIWTCLSVVSAEISRIAVRLPLKVSDTIETTESVRQGYYKYN